MDNNLKKWVKERYGITVDNDQEKMINTSLNWWSEKTKWHETDFYNGETLIQRRRYSMKMAKKICEDWASVLLNEKTLIKCDDTYTQEWLNGKEDNTVGGFFKYVSFWDRCNNLIEKTFASGTGAVVLRLENILENGYLTNNTNIKLNYVMADNIVPLTVVDEEITECLFVSKIKNGYFVEEHLFESGTYNITNIFLNESNGSLTEIETPHGYLTSFSSSVKMFSVIKPNFVNNVSDDGRGLSVIYKSLDQIKGCDLAYDNYLSDIELGKKMIFMNKDLIGVDINGNKVTPQNANNQLFHYTGEKTSGENQLIYEFNPTIRVSEDSQAIQDNLDYLSFAAGFGTKRYKFNLSTSITTATEYVGEKQDLIQSLNKQYISVEKFIIDLISSILVLQNEIDSRIKPDATITVLFDDSFIENKEQLKAQDLILVSAGIMNKWEYRVKWLGEDEETAKSNIAQEIGYVDSYADAE